MSSTELTKTSHLKGSFCSGRWKAKIVFMFVWCVHRRPGNGWAIWKAFLHDSKFNSHCAPCSILWVFFEMSVVQTVFVSLIKKSQCELMRESQFKWGTESYISFYKEAMPSSSLIISSLDLHLNLEKKKKNSITILPISQNNVIFLHPRTENNTNE